LLSKNDEYILMKLFTKYVFKGETTLSNFFTGYCGSDEQTYEVSEPNFSQTKVSTRPLSSVLHSRKTKGEVFLPLMDDWYFKPLLYVHKVDDQSLQTLVSFES